MSVSVVKYPGFQITELKRMLASVSLILDKVFLFLPYKIICLESKYNAVQSTKININSQEYDQHMAMKY